MRAIIAEDQPFTRSEYRRRGIALFEISRSSSDHQAGPRTERRGLAKSTVRLGLDVLQLARLTTCVAPHVLRRNASTLKLTRVAGAYGRGDEKNPQLQRIYGTAWERRPRSRPPRTVAQPNLPITAKLGQEPGPFSFPRVADWRSLSQGCTIGR